MSYFFGWGNDVEVTVLDTAGKVRVEPARHDGRAGEPARLRHHATLHRPARPPGDVQPRCRCSRCIVPVPLGGGLSIPRGPVAADGDSTDVVWHDVESCYVFHPMNAFDDPDGDGVVLDVVRHPSMFRTHLNGPPKVRRRWSAGTWTVGAAR